MAEKLKTDICVIGAGAAGLAVAMGVAALGAPVILVEKGRMGGTRLNAGGIPSMAMIAAGRRAETARGGGPFGIESSRPGVEFDRVNDHIHRVIGAAAANDSRERLTGLGVRVIEGEARFRDTRTLIVGPADDVAFEIRARRFVIATGSRPIVPKIAGIEQSAYLTNETVFEVRERPKHLIVIGGEPAGLELAQAFRRLGSEVTVLDPGEPLQGEDAECAAVVLDALAREGVTVRNGVRIERVRRLRQRVEVVLSGDTEETIQGTDLLIAAGREPNVASLGLEAARIKHQPGGIVVNKRFGTTNKRVYAVGDVIDAPRFSHVADHHAALLVRHLMFWLPVNRALDVVPRVTFTDPELAHVGLTDIEARREHGAIRVLRWPYRDNDRAQAERRILGHIKVVTDAKGVILGATIVGASAGEQIVAWALALNHGLDVRAFADMIVPYPTYMDIGKRAAATFFAPRLPTSWARRLLNLLRRLG